MADIFGIAPGVGFARFAGRTIILDIRADRYWQLGEAAGRVLSAVANGSIPRTGDGALDQLLALGLVVRGPERRNRVRHGGAGPIAARGALEESGREKEPIPAMLQIEAAARLFSARAALKRRPLRDVLCRLAVRRARTRPRRPARDLAALARQFDAARRLLPFAPVCLPDSLALLHVAIWHGHAPRLVFGVEAFPFAAHCWVQQGTLVLNDALDHARRFTPIFVL